MMKSFILFLGALVGLIGFSSIASAQNFTLGIGPTGNFHIIDGSPQLSPGIGGQLWLDYRWSPQLSTQFGVMVTTQDGEGPNKGDNGIEFLGIPTFDVKYFFMASDSHWDPYLLAGIGVYAITQGTVSNGTPAVGMGASAGLGIDYYFTQKFSMGLSGVFRSIGLIDSTGGGQNGSCLFPLSMSGYVGFHF